MKEIWRHVKKYGDIYSISDRGRVRANKRTAPLSRERYVSYATKTRILKPYPRNRGYLAITLSYKRAIKTFSIHRLVAQAFINNPENKPCVNHINGLKTDNSLKNLEWCTYSENSKHAFKLKLNVGAQGEAAASAKLNNKKVIYIRQSDKSLTQLSDIFNVSVSAIRRAKNKKTWGHIADN